MKPTILFFAVTVTLIASCKNSHPSAEEAQANPKALAETVFYLIQNEKYDALPALIDEAADDDSKQLAALKDADVIKQKQTREYFKSAGLNGEPVINGDKATVKIKLGHKGAFEETFEMIKRDGKWYLQSY